MTDRVREVLEGGVGYFWLWEDAVSSLDDDKARSGFIRGHESAVEVHLLIGDVISFDPFTEPAAPRAIVGATEHSGVLVLDLVGGVSRGLRFGGNRASVERFMAQTLITSSEALDATSPRLTEASVYVYGEPLLRWAGLHPVTRTIKTRPGTNVVESAHIDLAPANLGTTRLYPSGELVLEPHWNVKGDRPEGMSIEVALEVGVRVGRPRPSRDLLGMLVSPVHHGAALRRGRGAEPAADRRRGRGHTSRDREAAEP